MAFLLGWISLDGRPLDSEVWARLVARAQARTLFAGTEIELGHARLYAAVQRPHEAAPLRKVRSDRCSWEYLLTDCAGGDSDEWVGPEPPGDSDDPSPCGVVVRASTCTPCAWLKRDLGGQRAIYRAKVEGSLLFATGADVLRAHPSVGSALDEESIAAYLAGAPPPAQSSMFRGIAALAPGEEIEVAHGRIRSCRSWLRPDDSWRQLADQDIVEKTQALIHAAVVNACRGAPRIGVSLSAGLDSSTVAAIAVRHCASLVAATYGFDRWPGLDERPDVGAFAQSLGIELRAFAADDHGTLVEPDQVVSNPDFPCTTPFRRLADLAMDEIGRAGADLYLDGNLADHLYANPVDAWSDVIRMRRFGPFVAELRRVISVYGKSIALKHPGWRRLAARLLRRPQTIPLCESRLREPWRRRVRERLAAEQSRYRDFPRPEQAAFALDGTAANIVPREQFHAAQRGLELRSPFRDPALLRWMLSLPADFSYRDGHCKWVQRASMQELLPHEVCWRPKTGSPQPFFEKSLRIADSTANQMRAIAREWLDEFIDPGAPAAPGLETMASWLDAELGAWAGRHGVV